MGSSDNINVQANQIKPQKAANLQRTPLRGGRFGELMNQPLYDGKQWSLADEGSYFYSQNPAIDAATTIAGHAAPVLADLFTKPFIIIKNNTAGSQDIRLYLDFIHITVITPGANGTSDNWAAEIDTGNPDRSTTTGTTLLTVNPNLQSTASPAGVLKAGPLVASAPSANARRVGHGVMRTSIAIAGDQYMFRFGESSPSAGAVVAAAASSRIIPLPPVVLGAQDQFLLHLYAPSQSAAAVYKVIVGHVER